MPLNLDSVNDVYGPLLMGELTGSTGDSNYNVIIVQPLNYAKNKKNIVIYFTNRHPLKRT